jgi:antitoxin component of RelBE/YafQ-DinJ toxin-antitoxin module
METAILSTRTVIDADVKKRGEAAILDAGMTFAEYVRRVMKYAADGGDLSVIAARRSGVRNGVKTA